MNDLSRKTRWLMQTLILSAGLNVALTALFFYFIFRDNTFRIPILFFPSQEIVENNPFHEELLIQLKNLSFEKLVELLNDERVVEEPYHMRDLALGVLVKEHYFDLSRAMGRRKVEKKIFSFPTDSLALYPNLRKKEFESIVSFVDTEQFPFITEGLFYRIKKNGLKNSDFSLLQTFCQTREFIAVEMLFERAALPAKKGNLLTLLMEGDWEDLENYFQSQQESCDLSSNRLRRFLLSYFNKSSPSAAYFLLLKEIPYILENFNEEKLVKLLGLLSIKTNESQRFVKILLDSSKTELVKQKAAEKLTEYSEEIAGRFIERPGIGQLRPLFREPIPASPSPQTHIIQPGESLWKIAVRYHVSIDEIMQLNRLQSTVIRPGMTLSIPLRK